MTNRFAEAVKSLLQSAPIQAVAIDMTTAYELEIKAHCPQAEIVYDLFQVVAKYGREVIDRVRVDQTNRLQYDRPARKALKSSRWLLLRNREPASRAGGALEGGAGRQRAAAVRLRLSRRGILLLKIRAAFSVILDEPKNRAPQRPETRPRQIQSDPSWRRFGWRFSIADFSNAAVR